MQYFIFTSANINNDNNKFDKNISIYIYLLINYLLLYCHNKFDINLLHHYFIHLVNN